MSITSLSFKMAVPFLLAGIGCSLPTARGPHVLIDSEGYAVSHAREKLSEQEFRGEVRKLLKAVEDQIKSAPQSNKPKPLLIYIHGGLTTYSSAIQYVDEMVDGKTGKLNNADFYPMFLIWDSSFLTTWLDDIFWIRNGELNPIVAWLSSPLYLTQRVVKGFIRTPIIFGFQMDVAKMPSEDWAGEKTPSFIKQLGYWGHLLTMLPIHFVSYPFLEGFGTGAWEMMKRRIDQMFALQIRVSDYPLARKVGYKGAARVFFEELEAKLSPDGEWTVSGDQKIAVEITLAGHSMGTMVINRLLKEFPNIRFKQITYMGAATGITDFRDSIVPYLNSYPDTRFFSFSLAIKDEAGETNPKGMHDLLDFFPINDLAPRGSLLVWIDNIFEPGLSGGDKRAGWWRNWPYVRIGRKEEICSRMHFIKYRGDEKDPHRHGDFNNDRIFQDILKIATDPGPVKKKCESCLDFDPCSGLGR